VRVGSTVIQRTQEYDDERAWVTVYTAIRISDENYLPVDDNVSTTKLVRKSHYA